MRSYGPPHWLNYYDTHVIMCAWYYTSCCIQQTWNKTAKYTSLHAPKYVLKYTTDCTRLYIPNLHDLRSHVCSEDSPKYTSEHVFLYTPGNPHKDAPNCTRWHTPSLLDYTLPSKLSRRSQAHSWACSQWCSQLRSMAHSQPAWLYALKKAVNKLSSILPSTLSSTLMIATYGILPACLTIRSQVSS